MFLDDLRRFTEATTSNSGGGLLGGQSQNPMFGLLAMLGQKNPVTENSSVPQDKPWMSSAMQGFQAPSGLNEKLSGMLPGIMEDLRAKGWNPMIASAIRTPEEQAEKVRQGYSQAMNSKHLYGKAVDIVDKNYGWDGKASDPNFQFWKDLGEAAKKRGATWGGDWKSFKDPAHVQVSLLNALANQDSGLA